MADTILRSEAIAAAIGAVGEWDGERTELIEDALNAIPPIECGASGQWTYEQERALARRVIETNGADRQREKCVEELGELISALMRRGEDYDGANIQEEIADVGIMLTQMSLLYGEQEVADWRDRKLQRLEDRLNGTGEYSKHYPRLLTLEELKDGSGAGWIERFHDDGTTYAIRCVYICGSVMDTIGQIEHATDIRYNHVGGFRVWDRLNHTMPTETEMANEPWINGIE